MKIDLLTISTSLVVLAEVKAFSSLRKNHANAPIIHFMLRSRSKPSSLVTNRIQPLKVAIARDIPDHLPPNLIEEQEEKMSLSSSSFNLVKTLVGAGVLSFPSAVAAFADVPRALIPASVILCVLGLLSAYSFYSIGRTCGEENVGSLGEAWKATVSEQSSWIVDLACFVTPLGTAASFSIVLGDLFSSIFRTFGVSGLLASRQASILLVTISALYPLCSLKSLAALTPASILGVFCSFITCAFLGFRLFGGAYVPGGSLYSSVSPTLQPLFGVKGMNMMSPSCLILFSMAATGYMVSSCRRKKKALLYNDGVLMNIFLASNHPCHISYKFVAVPFCCARFLSLPREQYTEEI